MQIADELPLEVCVLELRYNHVFLLWDRVGELWTAMLEANPQLKVSAAQPTQQTFETKTVQIYLDTAMVRVTARGPKAIEELSDSMVNMLALLAELLRLKSFTRAGFRVIRTREFPTAKEAMGFAGEVEVKGSSDPEVTQVGFLQGSRFETEKFGLMRILKVEERELNFLVPWDAQSHVTVDISPKKWIVQADADYYTIGIVEQESFDPRTWVRQAMKTINRYWDL
jgi:hypothetical protein